MRRQALRGLDAAIGAGRFGRRVTDAPLKERTASAEEVELLARLRAGDERAFEALVDRHYAHDARRGADLREQPRAVAEEVVQEAWLGVLKGLDRFEGRSSLETWIMRIVVNIAKTRGVREARSVPFASLAPRGRGAGGRAGALPRARRRLSRSLARLSGELEQRSRRRSLHERETLRVAMDAIAELPPAQRAVITMRDVQGCGPDEVCAALEVSDGNQRVLLHRARSRVRAALERHLDG